MKHVFVSGCFDPIHVGHIRFFEQARALGDSLTVCIASDKSLWLHKKRIPTVPVLYRAYLIASLRCVDHVIASSDEDVIGLDFATHFRNEKPHILAVTKDDRYEKEKRELCSEVGAEYVVVEGGLSLGIHSRELLSACNNPLEVPLRVDLAGGWLDVPKYARIHGHIVNCAITPGVSIAEWHYEKDSGLGGSAAWAILNGQTGCNRELGSGVGWQDVAVIHETGLCVWRSGPVPRLEFKTDGSGLIGKMALYWTGKRHSSIQITDLPRNFSQIEKWGNVARTAVYTGSISMLQEAVTGSYTAQLNEGMDALPHITGAARKYCGSGWGGYALYIFENQLQRDAEVENRRGAMNLRPIEPYIDLPCR